MKCTTAPFEVQVDQTQSEPDMTQLTQMTPVPHPAMIGLSPYQQAEVVLSGYRDCATEAIRYLIEVENLAPDDPLVVGLKNHLYEQQKALNFGHLIFNSETYSLYANGSNTLNDSGISVPGDTMNSSSESSDMNIVSQETNIEADDNIHTSFLNDGQVQNDHISSGDSQHGGTVQCNNATITALAEEILSLLEENESISDVECDDVNDVEQ